MLSKRQLVCLGMNTTLPITVGAICGFLALLGLRELIKELATATTIKAG